MNFLVFENGIVKVTDEGMGFQAIKDLYAHDKTKDKKLFQQAITYMYFAYKKDGLLDNILPTEKKLMVGREFLKGIDINTIEKDSYFQKVLTLYISLQFTPIEQLYEGIKTDIDEILKSIKNIRFTKTIKVDCTVDIPDKDGNMQTVHVKQDVEIDNSEEKSKTITLAEKLIDYEKKIRMKILDESKQKRKSESTGRLFDR